MRILLDTHTLLWTLADDPKLDAKVREAIINEANEIFASVASVWEISIKQSLGKLDAPENLVETLEATRVDLLPIIAKHAIEVRRLPLHHRDPFDRMLIAQARIEGMTVSTQDPEFGKYDVPLLVS
ncbi:MAG: type II toxin-antitoxin system VapC family toxin [Candidatus Omnitrophica bacterium]|nr:type II toxin-antitoxin system VapC family toxin [Candidatus Omnitrophota bacterium]